MDEAQEEEKKEIPRVSTYWWIRQVVLIAIAGFYLVFGIQLLISAYQLSDATHFIYTFYAANFMILFSGALMVGFVIRMVIIYKRLKNSNL